MSKIIFKSPTKEEFKQVESVFIDVWNQNLLEDVFIKHINSEEHSIICAYMNKEIVGVVSSFLSISGAQERRWEVDLVVVKKKCQGLGIGARLVQETLKKAKEHSVEFARAVVRVDNIASQNIFRKSQFKTDNITYSLQLWEPNQIEYKPMKIENITYLPMDTLGYKGLWIENLFNNNLNKNNFEQAIHYAQQKAFLENRQNTGALISQKNINKIPKSILDLSKCQGEYNWWVYKL